MHIEERLEHFIATMINTETALKVFLYVVGILLAYNYFFYLSLVGLIVGIPLYYIQTNGIRSIEDFYALVRPKNTVVDTTTTTTTATITATTPS